MITVGLIQYKSCTSAFVHFSSLLKRLFSTLHYAFLLHSISYLSVQLVTINTRYSGHFFSRTQLLSNSLYLELLSRCLYAISQNLQIYTYIDSSQYPAGLGTRCLYRPPFTKTTSSRKYPLANSIVLIPLLVHLSSSFAKRIAPYAYMSLIEPSIY